MKRADYHYLQLSLLWLAGFLTAWLLALPQWGGPGLTWDEAYYYPTFVNVRDWMGQLATSPGVALSPKGIDAGWALVGELPPLLKWLGAVSLVFGGPGWQDLAAVRLVPAAAFGTALVLLRLIALRLVPRRWAWLPVAVYALHPHVVGHAQLVATETLFSAVNLLVLWAALRLGKNPRTGALLAACLGLALATKVNGLILVCIIAFWLLTRRFFGGRGVLKPGVVERQTLLRILFAPLLAIAIWPWLWSHPTMNLPWYIHFIFGHGHQPLWYLGQKWNSGAPMAPLTYPTVMLHLTTPVALLALTWAALLTGLAFFAKRRRIGPRAYLVALLFLGPLTASSLPGAPKYDSIRLFFPMLAPAALLTGIGLHWLSLASRRPKLILGAPVVALLMALPLQRPTIDFFNLPTRLATRSQTVFPFEETWWCNGMNRQMVEDLNAKLPPNARVKTLALQADSLLIYQKWKLLREDIQVDKTPAFDVHLLQNRRGLWGNAEWSIWSSREPLETWGKGAGGEPLIYLFDGRPPGM